VHRLALLVPLALERTFPDARSRSFLAGTYCGVFRRQALDRGADLLEVDHIVTGHNADDVAETVLMNGALDPFARLVRSSPSVFEGRS